MTPGIKFTLQGIFGFLVYEVSFTSRKYSLNYLVKWRALGLMAWLLGLPNHAASAQDRTLKSNWTLAEKGKNHCLIVVPHDRPLCSVAAQRIQSFFQKACRSAPPPLIETETHSNEW